ncbi:MAG: DMT family transporter [Pseudomonadota bacterium]
MTDSPPALPAVPAVPVRSALAANGICLLSMLTWAAGLPALGHLVNFVPPLTLTAWRVGLAGAVLVLAWAVREGVRTVVHAPWNRGLYVGFLVMGVGAVLLVVAIRYTDPVTAAIITSFMPIVGIGTEVLFDGRRVTLPLVAGLLLSLGGGVVAVDPAAANPSFGLGALAALASLFSYAWGSRLSISAFPGMSALGRSAITVAGGGAILTALAAGWSLAGGPGVDWAALGPGEYAAVAGASIGSVAVSQTLWIVAVGAIGIGLSSLHMNAVPFYVMLISLAFGGDWQWNQALGAAIVVLGVSVAQGLVPLRFGMR